MRLPRTTALATALALVALATTIGAPTRAHAATGLATHRSTSSANILSGTALTLPTPAGTAAGDLLLARIANRDHVSATVTAPTGWTLVRFDHSTYAIGSWIYRKVATSTEPTSYTFRFDVASSLAGSVSSFVGVDPSAPVDTSSGKINGSSASFTGTAVTTSNAADLAVWFGSQAANRTDCPKGTISQPGGFTEPLDTCLGSSSAGLAYDVAYAQLSTAGTQPAWNGSSDIAATNITQEVALRPLASQSGTVYSSTWVTVGKLWDGYNADGTKNTDIPLTVLYQPSGLAASRINSGVLYAQSEKDRKTMVALRASDAKILGKYTVSIPNVFDWEDVATGPCPSGTCVFAGDIGSSREITKPTNVFSVTRVLEPNLAAGKTNGTLTGDTFFYTYPAFAGQAAGQKLDAESLMVHPTTGQIYVITKDASGAGLSRVFAFPSPLPAAGSTTVLTYVTTLALPTSSSDPAYSEATAASIAPSGDRFLLRTYRKVYEYRATSSSAFESAFVASPVSLTDTAEGQGEAIEYAADASAYFTLSEATAPPYTLKRVDRA